MKEISDFKGEGGFVGLHPPLQPSEGTMARQRWWLGPAGGIRPHSRGSQPPAWPELV